MATYTATTYNFDLSVAANFRTLFGDIDSKIQSLGGWTYVAQTGDFDPSAAAAPTNGTFGGFRCYSTTIGSTTWYLRFDSGRNNGPAFKIQFGTSLNGSGTLGGQTSTAVSSIATGGTNNTLANQSLHMAAASGRLMIFFGLLTSPSSLNGSTLMLGFSAYGTVDGSGAMTGDMEYFYGASSSPLSQYIPASGTVPPQRTLWPAAFGNTTSDVIGTSTMTGHPVTWGAGGANNPTPAAMVYGSADLSSGFTTTVSIYSATRTFLCTSLGSVIGNGPNIRGAFLYE